MKKQMTERETEEFLHMLSTGHLASSSVSAANAKGAMKRTSWIDMETAKIHYAIWGTTGEGMGTPPKKY